MEELLQKLRKAVNHALDVRAPQNAIPIQDFPAYVVKSLEQVLADTDGARAASRLGVLKAKVDEAVGLVKQSAGAAEDTDSQRINVPVFEEPGLTAKPSSGSEAGPAATGAADGAVAKAIEQLRQEVDALKKAVAGGKGKDGNEEDKQKARGKDGSEEDKQKARGKDGSEEDKQKARGKDGSEEDEQKARGKGAGGGDGGDTGDEEKDQEKAGGKGKSADKDAVAKSTGWPMDMNATMPGAESIAKRHPDLDWGTDPEDLNQAQ